MIETAFWIALLGVAYPWVGYPLLLALTTTWRHCHPVAGRRRRPPRVSVIVAAFNEAATIQAKIRSTLGQQYPSDRLEVIVVSDGSHDGTDAIVARDPDPRVRLLRQEPRQGKSAALNRGVAAATGEVLVFTDANAPFAPRAIATLVQALEDSGVGLVSGQGLYAAGPADPRAVSNGYARYEAFLKRAESALGFLAGADGAVYALRRELYRELDATEVNDLLHPVQVALTGLASRFTADAITIEPPSRSGGQEFRRHVRIVAQNAHIVRRWVPALVAARRWRPVWILLSHRVLRWFTAPLLVVLLASTLALMAAGSGYALALAGQGVFYAAALFGCLAERLRMRIGPLAIPYYFCVVALAGVAGLVRCFTSGAESVWAPTGQTTVAERAA